MTEIVIEIALEVCTNTNEVLELAGLCGAEEAGATLFGQLRKDLSESARMCCMFTNWKKNNHSTYRCFTESTRSLVAELKQAICFVQHEPLETLHSIGNAACFPTLLLAQARCVHRQKRLEATGRTDEDVAACTEKKVKKSFH